MNFNPKIVTITSEGFVEADLDDPKSIPFIMVEIPNDKYFRDNVKYSYKITENREDPFYKGRILWESGMQKMNCSTVVVFTDDFESGIFLGGHFQNDRTFPFLFGKVESSPFEDMMVEIFTKYFDDL